MFHFIKKGRQFATAAKKGKVELTQINDREIRGHILGVYNEDNYVNGSFTAVVCDRMELEKED